MLLVWPLVWLWYEIPISELLHFRWPWLSPLVPAVFFLRDFANRGVMIRALRAWTSAKPRRWPNQSPNTAISKLQPTWFSWGKRDFKGFSLGAVGESVCGRRESTRAVEIAWKSTCSTLQSSRIRWTIGITFKTFSPGHLECARRKEKRFSIVPIWTLLLLEWCISEKTLVRLPCADVTCVTLGLALVWDPHFRIATFSLTMTKPPSSSGVFSARFRQQRCDDQGAARVDLGEAEALAKSKPKHCD